jgi:hypothetical protein
MKKFLKSILLFLPFAIVFYFVLFIIWGDFMPSLFQKKIKYEMGSYGHMYTRVREIKNYKNPDVLILGGSHAYRGFDVRILKQAGYRAFILASSSQTPIQTKLLLERYLDTINPKFIIYEVYPGAFCSDGVESSVDLIANDVNDSLNLEMARAINSSVTYHTLLYKAYRDLMGRDLNFKEPVVKDDDTYISGGYVERKMQYYKPEKFNTQKWKVKANQFEAFKQIVNIIKRKKIRLVLVCAPIPPTHYNAFINNAEFDNYMRRYADYYNFNTMMHLNDSLYFNDNNHLNQEGVKLFNKELLNTKGIFKK